MPKSRGTLGDGEVPPLDGAADAYVRLVLAVERHDRDFIDAYSGPRAWLAEARRGKPAPLPDLLRQARALLDVVRTHPLSERRDFLERQLVALESSLRQLAGEHLGWREMLATLLDSEPVAFAADEVEAGLDRLATLLPGRGKVAERLGRFLRRFSIRPERLRTVAKACLDATRARTEARFKLPPGESVRLRLVRGVSWAAYSRYLGGGRSVIEINADRPHHPGGLLQTMAHEAYPGHHTFAVTREEALVRRNGWREHAVHVLLSPLSVIAEGAAYLALSVVMEEQEVRDLIRRILTTEPGFASKDVDTYLAVNSALGIGGREISLAMEAGRRALEEGATSREIMAFMIRGGVTVDFARSMVPFIGTYKAYVCSYRLGLDLLTGYLGEGADRIRRYGEVLRRPFTPTALRRAVVLPEPRSRS